MPGINGEEKILKSIHIGPEYISIGHTRLTRDEMHFKNQSLNPLAKFMPIMGGKIEDMLFQERKLWVPRLGDVDIVVRLYMSDLMGNEYYAMANPQDIAVNQHLTKENQSLKMEIERLFKMLKDVSNEDLWNKRIKAERERYSGIVGGGSYGMGYGTHSSLAPNVGTGFGGSDEYTQ